MRELAHHADDLGRQRHVIIDGLADLGQLAPGGQLEVPQQVDDFFKSGVFGQVFNPVAHIDELPLSAVHFAELGLSNNNVLQAFGGGIRGGRCLGHIRHGGSRLLAFGKF